MQKNKTVEGFIEAHQNWHSQLTALRQLLVDKGFQETIKWGAPTYCIDGKNLIGLGAFKEYVGLWFYQGALLEDKTKSLVNAQEGKTKALRQWRFNSEDILPLDQTNAYVSETIANHKAGKAIKADTSKPLIIPQELQSALDDSAELTAQFEQFGKSKQREFAEHILSAKREATKLSRLEKIIPMIQQGIGLNDKYRQLHQLQS